MKNKWESGRVFSSFIFSFFSFLFNEEPMFFVCKGQSIQHKKGQKMSHISECLSPELSCDHFGFFPRKGCRCSLDPNIFLESN